MVGGTVCGDGALRITGVNGIAEAHEGDITFARSPKYFDKLLASQASAALTPRALPEAKLATICVAQPDLAFFLILQRFAKVPAHPPAGVHPLAYVASDVELGANVAVGPCACVESGAILADGVVLYPGAYVGRGCRIGRDAVLYPNAVIREECIVGERCVIHAGACIGSDGFGFAPMGGLWHKIPQTGIVVIGDDVEIGSLTAVDRATFGQTRIGNGTKIDNLVQIGHNVCIGDHCAIAGMVGVAGSATVGNHVRIGANAGVAGHIQVGDGASVGARAGVMRSVDPGAVVSGFPAVDHDMQRRILVAQQRTPEMLKRLAKLERRLKELEDRLSDETENHS